MDKHLVKASLLAIDSFNSTVFYEVNDEMPCRFGSFTTGGRIETGLEESGVMNYQRGLSLDSALIRVSFLEA